MVKKSLIAVAVALLLVTTVNAAIDVTGPMDIPHGDASGGQAIKAWGSEEFTKTFSWPYEVTWTYTALDICKIPVYMEIGMYIEIIDCDNAEILMTQVDCGNVADFPCYAGETTVHAVSNFDALLGLNTTITAGDILHSDNFGCAITSGASVPGDGNEHAVTIGCAAKKAKLYKHVPGTKVEVAEVTITVKPAS